MKDITNVTFPAIFREDPVTHYWAIEIQTDPDGAIWVSGATIEEARDHAAEAVADHVAQLELGKFVHVRLKEVHEP